MTKRNGGATNDNGGIDRDDELQPDRGAHWRQVAQRHYDPDRDGELTTAIVFAVADAAGVSPKEIKSPPLYEIVDVAAIEDALFGPETPTDSRPGTGSVEFRYTDYLVTIGSDGWIQVYEAIETDRP
jgi:hypothetical protein